MGDLYSSKKLSNRGKELLLKKINNVIADADWDGISAAAQFKFHYPKIKVTLSTSKCANSDNKTIVLDQWTKSNGFIIDHHTTSPYKDASSNVLLFSKSGEIPTSRLVYLFLGKRDVTGLFLSATAEITDCLHRIGMKNGSLRRLKSVAPYYFIKSNSTNQFLNMSEIYEIGDILAVISKERPNYALKLALRLYENIPRDSSELIAMLNKDAKKLVKNYKSFIRNLNPKVENVNIGGRKIKILDKNDLGRFYMPALEITRRKIIGNYILFKGDGISIRTKDLALVKLIIEKLSGISSGYGGRAGAYAIRFKGKISYGKFKKIIS
jgi:hypothetical protein